MEDKYIRELENDDTFLYRISEAVILPPEFDSFEAEIDYYGSLYEEVLNNSSLSTFFNAFFLAKVQIMLGIAYFNLFVRDRKETFLEKSDDYVRSIFKIVFEYEPDKGSERTGRINADTTYDPRKTFYMKMETATITLPTFLLNYAIMIIKNDKDAELFKELVLDLFSDKCYKDVLMKEIEKIEGYKLLNLQEKSLAEDDKQAAFLSEEEMINCLEIIDVD